MTTPEENLNTQDHTNNKLAYEYTESTLKIVSAGIDVINTKLSTVLGFGGVLLRFAADLPSKSEIVSKTGSLGLLGCLSLLLKLGVCLLSAASIILAIAGLYVQKGGDIVPPKRLMKKRWYYESDERCRAYIIKTWLNAFEELTSIRTSKAKRLKQSLVALGLAAVVFALDISVTSVFN